MKNITNPKWLPILNTLPIIALFIIFIEQFNIIKSFLYTENIRNWLIFCITLGALGISNLAYSIFLIIKKQKVSFLYGIISIPIFVLYLYFLYKYSYDIIFWNVPDWMINQNQIFYPLAFLMPTICYSLFLLVYHFTIGNKKYKAWLNFLIAVSVPVTYFVLYKFYIFIVYRNKYIQRIDDIFQYFLVPFFIITTILFLFFLARAVYILAVKNGERLKKYQYAWKIPIAFIFPLLGLLVNNGILFAKEMFIFVGDYGVFGDFNNIWFYILAALNGIFICLPNIKNKFYRIALFAGRSILFAFTLYFFLVFLPLLPLSVIAVAVFAAGLLMLTPLALFIAHVNTLYRDYNYLKENIRKDILKFILVLGFAVLPVCITVTYMNDKAVLFKTLEYLYAPDYSKNYSINTKSLKKTLNVIENHVNRRWGINTIPFLTSFYNKLVLNNRTLSDDKINFIKSVFFNTHRGIAQTEESGNKNVEITKISTDTFYDEQSSFYRTWIDLEIKNKNNSGSMEYSTIFHLPEGCWISDYYLFVEDRKEPGILSEKRAAMWVYNNIRNIKRDPGILYYSNDNEVTFKVFPFAGHETRRTGIEFLHLTPVTLTIDGNDITMDAPAEAKLSIKDLYVSENNDNFVFVSAAEKKLKNELKSVQRKPYFHFLIDTSEHSEAFISDFSNRIKEVIENPVFLSEIDRIIFYLSYWDTLSYIRNLDIMTTNDVLSFSQNAKISFTNSLVNSVSFNDNWREQYESQKFEGGFFLKRAIQTALFNAYNKDEYPVFIVLTDNINDTIFDGDLREFKFAFPESNYFYILGKDGIPSAHSLINNPKKPLPKNPPFLFNNIVLKYKFNDGSTVYLPDNNEASIAIKNVPFELDEEYFNNYSNTGKQSSAALTLRAKQMHGVLYPQTANREYLSLVKLSFLSKIMTPSTSYIVVENEAQKAMLLKKQEQVLSGGNILDAENTAVRMSEPPVWAVIVLFGLVLVWRELRRAKRKNFLPRTTRTPRTEKVIK